MSLDQERFVALVSELFGHPYASAVNNDLPLEEPADVNWADAHGTAYRLRLYLQDASVLAVSQQARAVGHPWESEQRVLVMGNRAVRIARELGSVVSAAGDEEEHR